MRRTLQIAVVLGLFCAPGYGVILFFLDAPQDSQNARRKVQNAGALKPFKDDYNQIIQRRIWMLDGSDIARIFGPPIRTRAHARSDGSKAGDNTKDMALPLFAPSGVAVSGLASGDPAKDHDHTDVEAIGDIGFLRIYYGVNGKSMMQAVLYFRADEQFVPLKSTHDLSRRLAWEAERFAAVKKWLNQRLPPLTDLGMVQISEVSPLPEPKRAPGAAHQFKYAGLVPVRVQGGGMAFNFIGKAQAFPEAKYTNHWVVVTVAGAAAGATGSEKPAVFSGNVEAGVPVAFKVDGKVFSFTPKIVNIDAQPGD